ncbi:MAG: protein kinase [Candidatus Obscuribacterales bacterium]|nr:protein kinase [Candidatus Obscuribacterales bacterium]
MAEPPEAFVGIVLADRYELCSVLGQGQGGMVFKARHRQLDRYVAVKLLCPEDTNDKTAFMRFEREARSVGRLNHPNIVTVFDVGRWRNERPFLVMDYIEGQDLQDLIAADGRLSVARALRIATQVCSALQHAHLRGVIHRDLKPRNIMVLDAEEMQDFVKIVDFGVAKESGVEQYNEALTLDGYVVGTPLYMSPEQCTGEALDARCDIYALCAVLFKMLSGVNPISGKNLAEIMHNQIQQAPLSFEEASSHTNIPQEIQRVIYKGLSKNRAERQASMSQLRQELNDAFARVAGSGKETLGTAHNSEAESTKIRSNIDALRERAIAGDTIAQYELVLRLEFGQGCKANPEEAKRWLRFAAQQGMKEAQWRLGDHLLKGEAAFEVNLEEALSWLSKSAEQGYDQALFALGWCFKHGLGVNVDLQKAGLYYQDAARLGNQQAMEELRKFLESEGQSKKALAAAERILEQPISQSEDPELLYTMACRLRDSGKRADDRMKAAELFKKSARLGHDLAQLDLLRLSILDNSNEDQRKEAVNWLEAASRQNNQKAMLMLSACLKNGIGCKKDLERAVSMLEELAGPKFRNSSAKALLGGAFLTADCLNRNIPRGISLLKEAAETADAYAEWKLALCFRNGLGLMKDQKTAELLFARAAESGFPQGEDELWKPAGLQFTEAFQCFKAMSISGNKNAYYWLGICYEKGLACPRDSALALANFEQAKSKGQPASLKAIERLKAASSSSE